MSKVTICVPSRNEIFLKRTVDEIFNKARGDIEVIVGLDGVWDHPLPSDDPRLTIIHWGQRRGHRATMNAAAEIGKGDYWMKLDGHCALDEGFDIKLVKNCDSDWMVVPRRYSLNFEEWKPQDKTPVDYEYIRYPYLDGNFIGTTAVYYWMSRQRSRRKIKIDENMICQGSCMFMPMDYFRKLIYPLDESSYGYYIGEQFEIMMKIWLSGGKCMVNKNTWYAHLWKGNQYKEYYFKTRGENLPRRDTHKGREDGILYQTEYWLKDKWPGRTHSFEWLVDRFAPVPGWPEEKSEWML